MSLSDKDIGVLRQIFERSGGKAWEPPDPRLPFFDRAIAAGYLRRVDGRCGHEKFKDAMVTFTDAGRAALQPNT